MTMKYQIIRWRDIPVKVRVRVGRTRTAYPLSERFQKTVYRAAFRAKAITGDGYTQGWRTSGWSEPQDEHGEDPACVAAAVVATMEAEYSDARLDQLARNKGCEPAGPTFQEAGSFLEGEDSPNE